MSDTKPGLDDPESAAFAWARFRRFMGWMTGVAVIAVAIAIVVLDRYFGPLTWVTIAATIMGIGVSVLLTAALMGLLFLSSGTGHDEAVEQVDIDDDGARF